MNEFIHQKDNIHETNNCLVPKRMTISCTIFLGIKIIWYFITTKKDARGGRINF